MQEPESNPESEDLLTDIVRPPLYSRRSIWWFSFLITPVFGGVMLMQNLKDIGKRKEATIVFVISLLCTIIFSSFMSVYDTGGSYLSIIFNLVGAGFLSTYFKRNIPEASLHPDKKLVKPLAIALGIILLFVVMFYLSDSAALAGM